MIVKIMILSNLWIELKLLLIIVGRWLGGERWEINKYEYFLDEKIGVCDLVIWGI